MKCVGLASEDLKDRGNQGEKVNYVDTSVDDDAKDDRQKNVFRLNTCKYLYWATLEIILVTLCNSW